MNVMMVRAKIKEENVAAALAATEQVIQALEQRALTNHSCSAENDDVHLTAPPITQALRTV